MRIASCFASYILLTPRYWNRRQLWSYKNYPYPYPYYYNLTINKSMKHVSIYSEEHNRPVKCIFLLYYCGFRLGGACCNLSYGATFEKKTHRFHLIELISTYHDELMNSKFLFLFARMNNNRSPHTKLIIHQQCFENWLKIWPETIQNVSEKEMNVSPT